MRKILIRSALAMVVGCSALWAADFWEKKEFNDWSGKELEKMMFDSPWAKKVTVSMGGGLRGGGIDASSNRQAGGGGRGGGGGGRGGSGGGRGGGGGGGGRRGGGGGLGQSEIARAAPSMKLTVRWHSALPVKQAIVKNRLGAEGGELTPEMKQFLGREETHYIISVAGLPRRMARMAQNTELLKQAAQLRRKKKDPLLPEKVEVRTGQQDVNLYFLFPRSEPIELGDKDVEFSLELKAPPREPRPEGQGEARGGRGGRGGGGRGQAQAIKIKKKFKLKDMVYSGALEL